MQIGVHEQGRWNCPIYTETEIFRQFFLLKLYNIKFYENSFSGSQGVTREINTPPEELRTRWKGLSVHCSDVRGAIQNFREFEYTAQTISITNLRH